ncbi:hypothetical protein C0993_011716 [Termitomyces sp. T159_Od127]|nr:hypothetical protein C0993_011716 [Termitomyces sp. T159_Od127]
MAGSGLVTNKAPNSLVCLSLCWMLRKCFKAKAGMTFSSDALCTIGLDPATPYPIVLPCPLPHLDASTAFIEKATKHGLSKRAVAHWKRKANATPNMTITPGRSARCGRPKQGGGGVWGSASSAGE